jgi:hypothetical protein
VVTDVGCIGRGWLQSQGGVPASTPIAGNVLKVPLAAIPFRVLDFLARDVLVTDTRVSTRVKRKGAIVM